MRLNTLLSRLLPGKFLLMRMRALLLATALALAPLAGAPQDDPVAQAIHVTLETGQGTALSDLGALRRFYASRQDLPAWFDQRGLNQDGREAMAIVATSGADGLDPSRYRLLPMPPRDAAEMARRDMAFTAELLRFISDLRSGRDEWRRIDRDVDLPGGLFDSGSALAQALAARKLPSFLQSMAPQWPEYARLRSAYGRYGEIAAKGWPVLTAARSFDSTSATQAQRDTLRARLQAEDNTVGAASSSTVDFDQALRRYQERNGLVADGKAGPATLAALAVPAHIRRAQIAANMERLRWLPHAPESRYVLVNVPDATLEVWSGGQRIMESRVIVGKQTNPTPLFRGEITQVVANPPWLVPISIARKEMLPKLRRNPLYLSKNHIVVRNAPAGDPHGSGINWHDASSARYLPQLQQLPGDDNALGQIKLDVTDPFSVYLHDTPVRSLFARDNRFLSHGCIRVQEIGRQRQDPARGDCLLEHRSYCRRRSRTRLRALSDRIHGQGRSATVS